MRNLQFLYSHPIQYFTPLCRYLHQSSEFDEIEVYYCSQKGLQEGFDREFGVQLKWDIPLLEDYNFTFLPNAGGPKNEVGGFWSLRNWGIIQALWKAPRGYLIVHGWNYFTHCLAIFIAPILGHKVCLRAETPLTQELLKPSWKRWLRRIVLGNLVFRYVNYCLYIGQENRAFYEHYGVPTSKLIFTPYSVDNDRFRQADLALKTQKRALREQLQIPSDAVVILFCGKYILKKRPMDLLHAFAQMSSKQAFLVMLGEGELRSEMEKFTKDNKIQARVLFTGFVNQQAIVKYYACADVFVMCSGQGETWGLSTNEAMNFGLPVILSSLTGCTADLVQEGKNGYTFPTGDIPALKDRLQRIVGLSSGERAELGIISREIIDNYSYESIKNQLTQLPDL